MDIGSTVYSPIYPEKDQGRIISTFSLEGTVFYEVFFPKTKESMTLEGKDVKEIASPLEKLENGLFDPSTLFSLRILSERIDSLIYQDKIITANNFMVVPLPHQILAVNHVLEQFRPRCLIADEVGLGKTIEAALLFEELKLRNIVKRVLIVVPAGLTTQWKDELKLRFGEEFFILDRNSFKALKDLYGNVNIWTQYNYVITSLDFLKPQIFKPKDGDPVDRIERQKKRVEEHNKTVTSDCVNAGWDMVIIDEAHKLSKRLRRVRDIQV